jgi:hypothetical protein
MGVHEERQETDVAEAAGPEGPVAVPQLAADPAHRRPADRTQARLSGEALDVAVGQAPDVRPDDQRLERAGPDDRPRVRDDRADEPLERAPDLGHADRDLALGGLDPTRPVAVPGTDGALRPFVASPAEKGRHLVLDRALEDERGAQAPELAQLVGAADPTEQGLLDGGLDLDARGYSSFHGVVSSATCQVSFGAYAVFTFTAGSGRHLA